MVMDDAREPQPLVFMLDVDNTLLNNDQLKVDLAAKLLRLLGQERSDRFWELYEEVRTEREFVDYPLTVKRMAEAYPGDNLLSRLNDTLDAIPFKDYVYPGAHEAIAHMQRSGLAAIVSDGDPVWQPMKIKKSGLWDAVHGNVLILVHKEEELDKVFARFPAKHYCVVDDKARILAALERCCPTEFTTIFVEQGKYATPAEYGLQADVTVASIAEVASLSPDSFMQGAASPS